MAANNALTEVYKPPAGLAGLIAQAPEGAVFKCRTHALADEVWKLLGTKRAHSVQVNTKQHGDVIWREPSEQRKQ